jgi:hypothetical protein
VNSSAFDVALSCASIMAGGVWRFQFDDELLTPVVAEPQAIRVRLSGVFPERRRRWHSEAPVLCTGPSFTIASDPSASADLSLNIWWILRHHSEVIRNLMADC